MDYHGPRKGRRSRRRRRSLLEPGKTIKRRWRIDFHDPDGTRHGGMPTYGWNNAPDHLYTRRQLLALNLRPAQPVAAQLRWMRYNTERFANLYDINLAKPKRIPTLAQLHAIEKALQARRTCPICGQDKGYTIPTSLGCCVDCHKVAYPRTA